MANQIQYGFINLRDVFGRRVLEVGVDEVFTAIQETVDIHVRQTNFLFGELVERTTLVQRQFRTMGSASLQPIDENGRALPMKTGAVYTVGYPIQWAATRWGQGYVAGLKMTVEHANEQTRLMLIADANWMRYHIFAALFNNVTYTFNDDLFGDVDVLPIANGDAQTYYTLGGGVMPTTANHLIGQAAAIDNTNNPYQTGYDLLKSYPENAGQVFALVPTNLLAATKALADFLPVADPNVQLGSAADRLVGDPGIVTPGRLIGYTSGVFIYEWQQMPSNYIIMRATGSPAPLAMREDELDVLQGFRQVSRKVDFPWEDLDYRRLAGFGALNRTAAVVFRIGNATYAPPTGYALPMI